MSCSRWIRLLVVVVAGAVAAGCGGQAGGQTQKAELAMVKGFLFQPAKITVKAGQPIQLAMKNQDTVLHDFVITGIPVKAVKEADGADHGGHAAGAADRLHLALAPGQAGAVDFTPEKSGSFEYFCSEPGHKDAGMKGILVVQ